jgi:isoquinoline 1-oxidoreductase subunit beta
VSVSSDDKTAEAWVGTQVPAYTIAAIARATGINETAITLHRNVMGGGFGRRAIYTMDYVGTAAWLSKRIHKPVKVTWDREDDIRYGFFRPLTAHHLRAGLDQQGNILAWHHRVACEEPLNRYDKELPKVWGPIPLITMLGSEHQKEDRTPLIDAYALPDRLVEHMPVDSGIRVFAMRGVGATPNKFAIESFIDEIAASINKDPLDYRLQLLKQSSRGQTVLKRVAKMCDWRAQRKDRALGISYSYYGGSLTAAVAEISLDSKRYEIRVHNVWVAADVGIAVQPDNVRAQYEGGVIYGLSNCLKERINIKDGMVQQSNFHDYSLLRINEAPNIEVEVLDSSEHPTGVGELGTVIAPCAVANAFAKLTGRRLHYMPFFSEQIRNVLQA